MHTGERQAAKMRLAYLRAMLDQDIAVFDTEASTGEVINAITSDILVVPNYSLQHTIEKYVAALAATGIVDWQPTGARYLERQRRQK